MNNLFQPNKLYDNRGNIPPKPTWYNDIFYDMLIQTKNLKVIKKYYNSNIWWRRGAIIRNKNTPTRILKKMMYYEEENDRSAHEMKVYGWVYHIFEHPNADKEIREYLHKKF